MDEYDELDGNTEDDDEERRRRREEDDDPLPMMIADDDARRSMEGHGGCLVAALVVPAVALLAAAAHANPIAPEMDFYPFYWLLKTLPFNYAADFIALCLALLVFPQRFSIAWKRVPIYNLVVVAAGYTADWAGSAIAGYPTFRLSAKDPIVGEAADMLLYGADSGGFTFATGVGFMAATAAIIYLLNLAIIHGILSLNDVTYRPRHLHLAAAIIAVLTSPYIALRGAADAACFVPVSLALLGIAAYRFAGPVARRIVASRRKTGL